MLNLTLWSGYGYAAEKLRFDSDVPRSSFEKIKSFSNNTLNKSISGFDIAGTDLNSDGLDEYVLRSKRCENMTLCQFGILAETDGGIHVLGEFKGKNLLLGNEYTHGVRNILIFGNLMNDFDYEVYTWHPEASSYRKVRP